MSENILKRLKADNKTIKTVKFLVGAHMFDLDGSEPIPEVRKFIAQNYEYMDKLMLVKQADHCGYKDDLGLCHVVKKWQEIISEMRVDGTPFTLKALNISASDLGELGIKPCEFGKVLNELWLETVVCPKLNDKQTLKDLALKIIAEGVDKTELR